MASLSSQVARHKISVRMIGNKISVCALVFAFCVLGARLCLSFQPIRPALGTGRSQCSDTVAAATTFQSSSDSVTEEPSRKISLDPVAIQLKDDLVALASATRRGFSASRTDREKSKTIINDLAKYSPSDQPAAAYYEGGSDDINQSRSTLAGKWTLIYTDAPDITSLEAGGPFSTAKLGRIGQECNPPSIKNVIEWQRPDWASSLPFSGGKSSRILQKVCCEGSATQDNPRAVDLKIVGLELSGMNGDDNDDVEDNNGLNSFFKGPAALLESNPVKLQGPLTAPFGKFEIFYLDDDMRITKTYQGYYAVNIRDEAWF